MAAAPCRRSSSARRMSAAMTTWRRSTGAASSIRCWPGLRRDARRRHPDAVGHPSPTPISRRSSHWWPRPRPRGARLCADARSHRRLRGEPRGPGARSPAPWEDNRALRAARRDWRARTGCSSISARWRSRCPMGALPTARCCSAPTARSLTTYDKIHLFDATLPGLKHTAKAPPMPAATRAWWCRSAASRSGLTICYDVRFRGALQRRSPTPAPKLIAVPAAFTVPTGQAHWEVLLRARAIETGSYVIAAAQGGAARERPRDLGHSMIIDPWGAIVAAADDDEPGVIVAEIDPARWPRRASAFRRLPMRGRFR